MNEMLRTIVQGTVLREMEKNGWKTSEDGLVENERLGVVYYSWQAALIACVEKASGRAEVWR